MKNELKKLERPYMPDPVIGEPSIFQEMFSRVDKRQLMIGVAMFLIALIAISK